MNDRRPSFPLFFLALSLATCPSSGWGQVLREAKKLWASEPAAVPALARTVDLMIASGDLVPFRTQRDGQLPGRVHERLNQYHRGVWVFGGQVVWQKRGGQVLSVTGNLYEDMEVGVTPSLGADEAVARGLEDQEPGARVVGAVELVILPLDERFALVYFFRIRGRGWLDAVFVDAHSGRVLLRYDAHRAQSIIGLGIGSWDDRKKMSVEQAGGTHRASDRLRPFGIKTYDVGFDCDAWNNYASDTPAFLATDLDNEWDDGAVVDAHANSGFVYDYYFKRHGRRGLDDKGLVAINFVHILPRAAGFNNAFFDPVDNSMNYGDGDGDTFNSFASSLEVVAHEITHGVTQNSTRLIYLNESGALDEAFSDIMGTSVEFFFQQAGRGRQKADWILGEDLFFGFGRFVRSMENPRAVGFPDHYSRRCLPPVCTPDREGDNGGVHINSSIVNHAFYLMVEGGTNRTSGIAVEGVGRSQMDRIEAIFYRAFVFFLVPSSNFKAARAATIEAARDLYGGGSVEERTVRAGWNAVGVN